MWGLNTQNGTAVHFPRSCLVVCLRKKTSTRYLWDISTTTTQTTIKAWKTALAYLSRPLVQPITWMIGFSWHHLSYPHHKCDRIWCTCGKVFWDLWGSLFTLSCSVFLCCWLKSAYNSANGPPCPPLSRHHSNTDFTDYWIIHDKQCSACP